jgi:NADH:ubiquinone reductase (non-electrogenic)
VLLVDQSERFVFKPMLYELLSGGMLFFVIKSHLSVIRLHSKYDSSQCSYKKWGDKNNLIISLYAEVDAWEIAPRFLDLLASTSVQFFQDKVKVLHPADHLGINGPSRSNCGGTVHLESGLLIEYDCYNSYY